MKRTSSSKAPDSISADRNRSAIKLTKPYGVPVAMLPSDTHSGNNAQNVRRDAHARNPVTHTFTNHSGAQPISATSPHLSADDLEC